MYLMRNRYRQILITALLTAFASAADAQAIPISKNLMSRSLWMYGTVIDVAGPKKEEFDILKVAATYPISATIKRQNEVVNIFGCLEKCTEDINKNASLLNSNQIEKETPSELWINPHQLALFTQQQTVLDLNLKGKASSRIIKTETANEWTIFDQALELYDTNARAPIITLTLRWILRNQNMTRGFRGRSPHPQTRTMTTKRGLVPRVARFAMPPLDQKIPIYMREVPSFVKSSWLKAISSWNRFLVEATGRSIFKPVFLDAGDARLKYIIPGDPRYNVIQFSHVPLPTSVGRPKFDQVTGEIINFSSLISGSTGILSYRNWYVFHDGLARGVPLSQLPALHINFLREFPKNLPADKAFLGEAEGKLAHEFGHMIGFNHNNKGSLLFSTNSAMDIIRPEVVKNQFVGPYDRSAVLWSYGQIPPKARGWVCTEAEENPADLANYNPECTYSDFTEDPFKDFLYRLRKAVIASITYQKSAEGPLYSGLFLKPHLKGIVVDLFYYARISSTSFQKLMAFRRPGRPTSHKDMGPFVEKSMREIICDPSHRAIIDSNPTASARQAARENLKVVREYIDQLAQEVLGARFVCK